MKPRFWVLFVMTLVVALSRLIPHPPNFTPVAPMALFGGAYFTDKRWAFLVPFLALFMSDCFLGFYPNILINYGCFALVVCMGFLLRNYRGLGTIVGTVLASSVVFFFTSNFGVWIIRDFYPKNWAGLVECYVAAIPFFRNTLAGNVVYAALMFGSFELIVRYFPTLNQRTASLK